MLDLRRRIQYVTANYGELQGLRLVPLGLFFFTQAAGKAGIEPWTAVTVPTSWAQTAVCAPALLLFVAIGIYYRRTFGNVSPPPASARSVLSGIVIFGSYVLGVTLDLIGWRNDWPPVSLLALLFGLRISTAHLVRDGRAQMHYVLLGGMLAGTSLLPLAAGVGLDDPIFGSGGAISTIVLGLLCIVGGVLDHLMLVRTFQHVRQHAHG